MYYALTRYDGVGISAPQIGIPLRIIMIQVNAKQMNMWTPEAVAAREMEIVPLTVIINPVLKILDTQQVTYNESCCSMHGFSGPVSRSKGVAISGFDQEGEEITWSSKGWTARIIQHEYDH